MIMLSVEWFDLIWRLKMADSSSTSSSTTLASQLGIKAFACCCMRITIYSKKEVSYFYPSIRDGYLRLCTVKFFTPTTSYWRGVSQWCRWALLTTTCLLLRIRPTSLYLDFVSRKDWADNLLGASGWCVRTESNPYFLHLLIACQDHNGIQWWLITRWIVEQVKLFSP